MPVGTDRTFPTGKTFCILGGGLDPEHHSLTHLLTHSLTHPLFNTVTFYKAMNDFEDYLLQNTRIMDRVKVLKQKAEEWRLDEYPTCDLFDVFVVEQLDANSNITPLLYIPFSTMYC